MEAIRFIIGYVIGWSMFGAYVLIDRGHSISGFIIMILVAILCLFVGTAVGLGVL